MIDIFKYRVNRLKINQLIIYLLPMLCFSQGKWNVITQIPYCSFDDIAMSETGEIFASVADRDIVFASKDLGKSWSQIPLNESQVPAAYSHQLGFTGAKLNKTVVWSGRTYNLVLKNDSFIVDPNQGCQKYYFTDPPLYDYHGNFLANANFELWVYDSSLCNYSTFKTSNYVRKLFVYPQGVFGIESTNSGKNLVVSYDIKGKVSKQLSDSIPSYPYEILHITGQGIVLWAIGSILYRSIDGGKVFEEVKLSQENGPTSQILGIYNTLNLDVLIRTKAGFFLADSLCRTYTYLHAFSKQVPKKIIKLIAKDSISAVLLADQDDNYREMITFSSNTGWQPQSTRLHSYRISNLIQLSNRNLCGSFYGDDNTYRISENEGLTWSKFTYDSSAVIRVCNVNQTTDAILTQDKKLYISFDQNKNWKDITPLDYKESLGLYCYSDGRIIYKGTNQLDSTVIYISMDYGANWAKLAYTQNFKLSSRNFEDKGNHWILSFYNDTIYKSMDNGFNWEVDNRFIDLTDVWDIKVEENGTILVTGRSRIERTLGIFISKDSQPFKLLSSELKNSYFMLHDKYYPDILAVSHERGILRVDVNTGKITKKYNEGLPISIPGREYMVIGGLFWDKEDQLYVSIVNDNVYKNESKFMTGIEPEETQKSCGKLMFQKQRLQFAGNYPEFTNERMEIEIYDALGNVINRTIATGIQLQSGLELSSVVDGMFFVKVYNRNSRCLLTQKILILQQP